MRRVETIRIVAGETPMGTLSMCPRKPRHPVRAVVLRERDYRELLRQARMASTVSATQEGK